MFFLLLLACTQNTCTDLEQQVEPPPPSVATPTEPEIPETPSKPEPTTDAPIPVTPETPATPHSPAGPTPSAQGLSLSDKGDRLVLTNTGSKAFVFDHPGGNNGCSGFQWRLTLTPVDRTQPTLTNFQPAPIKSARWPSCRPAPSRSPLANPLLLASVPFSSENTQHTSSRGIALESGTYGHGRAGGATLQLKRSESLTRTRCSLALVKPKADPSARFVPLRRRVVPSRLVWTPRDDALPPPLAVHRTGLRCFAPLECFLGLSETVLLLIQHGFNHP